MSHGGVDVDRIWNNLGRTGRYQRLQIGTGLLVITGCSLHVFSIVFLGYRPSYKCSPDNLNGTVQSAQNSTFHIAYGQCSITKTTNVSGRVSTIETGCEHGWDYFDDGHFSPDRSVVSEWNLVCGKDELTELTQTLIMVGQGIGAFIFTSLADRFGRKKVHIFSHVMLCASAAVTALSPNYAMFAAMRMLTGAFQQGTGLTVAIILLELMPKEIRFCVEVAGLFFWTTGIAVVTPIAYVFRDMNWRYFQICLACLSAWSLIQWWITEESLRWLIANGRLTEAKRIIHKACKMNKKDFETVIQDTGFLEFEMIVKTRETGKKRPNREPAFLSEDKLDHENGGSHTMVQDEHVRSISKQYTVVDLFKSRRLLISSFIIWFTWITNSLTYYGIMLISSSLAGNRFLNFFLGSVVEYPAAFMELAMLTRYGRKPTTIVFHVICGIALIVATILTTTADGNSAMVLGSTVFTLIGKFGITGSFSTVFLYTPELYPTNLRNVGVGLASAAARIGGMVAPFSRNLAEEALWAPGLIFGCMCAIVAVALLWVPETNQYELPQTLEETEQWYKDNRFRLTRSGRRRQGEIVRRTTETGIPAPAAAST